MVLAAEVVAVVVHPAQRRLAAGHQVDGDTRGAHRAPAQTLVSRDRLDDERSADRLRVGPYDPRRPTFRCQHSARRDPLKREF